MKLHESRPAADSKSAPKRASRGADSGPGRNAGKNEEGQNARSGGGVRPGFEGGQMPLYGKLPRRGFTNPFTRHFVTINVGGLNIFDSGTEVTPELLLERKVVSKLMDGVKTLGNENIEKSLTIVGYKLSKQTAGRVAIVGGKVEVKQSRYQPYVMPGRFKI